MPRTSRRSADLGDPARVQHRDAVGDLRGDPEVVGDEHDAATDLVAQPARAGAAPAPAPSRRARWSARRRRSAPGHPRWPSRSSRAGAARRRARAGSPASAASGSGMPTASSSALAPPRRWPRLGTCVPIRIVGFSDVIGILEDRPDRGRRTVRRSAAARRPCRRPAPSPSPRSRRPPALGQAARAAPARHALARARLADQPEDLAAADLLRSTPRTACTSHALATHRGRLPRTARRRSRRRSSSRARTWEPELMDSMGRSWRL